MGIMLFLKVSGSQVIASGNGDKFALGFKFVMILVSVMSVAALVAALWKRVYVAHSYGETACMFAAESGCASAYAAIFQGSDSLKSVFSAFGPTGKRVGSEPPHMDSGTSSTNGHVDTRYSGLKHVLPGSAHWLGDVP